MAIAKIKTEKFLDRGKQKRKITGFENILYHRDVPVEYLNGFDMWPATNAPAFGMYGTELCMYIPKEAFPQSLKKFVHELEEGPKNPGIIQIDIPIGATISEAELKDLLTWLRRAGARLGKINRRLAEENKDWHGEEIFEI